MSIGIQLKLNPNLYLKNPEESNLGKRIIEKSIGLINECGYESYTFKKLAIKIGSTEASIYRYFENKHLLLTYLIDVYWSAIDLEFKLLRNLGLKPEDTLKQMLEFLVNDKKNLQVEVGYDINKLNIICIEEASKTYLMRDVDMLNSQKVFQPFKDVSTHIAEIILTINPQYKYSESLGSLVLHGVQKQVFFMQHLPRLSSFASNNDTASMVKFFYDMVINTLKGE